MLCVVAVVASEMFRTALVLCCIGLALAVPPVSRSREDIEAFRSYLESTKTNDGYLTRTRFNPLANPEENSGKYQGDILLDDWQVEALMQQYAAGRNAYTWPNTKWPNDTVVWEFGEGEFGPLQQAAIEEAIADIERHTCVKFRKRENNEPVYVLLTGGAGGCYAHVGYWQPRLVHTLNLARNYPDVGCFRHATIVHEWMHILGFLHMQSTHDRDDYVHIAEENLIAGTEHNFDIYSADLVDNLGVEYDYVSCLHYGPYAFSANGEKTIVALQEHEGTMGQRVYVTDKDWLRINRHYNCPGAWDEKEESEEKSEENKSESEENKSESEENKSESEENKSESSEESSEQNKSESSEQNKSESSEESSEQNKSESSEQNKSESSEESSEQNKSESSEQNKSESSEQNKSESSEQNKSESSEQNKSESEENGENKTEEESEE